MNTRLSVIIPGYNTPDVWWLRCVNSVLKACGPDDEIICIDDGSKVKPHLEIDDSRIRFVYLEKNLGQSSARNRALDCANGKYVAFVDSDDEILPIIYTEAISSLEDTGADISLFGVRVVWTNECLMKDDVPPELVAKKLDMADVKLLFSACLFEYPVNRVFRRSFIDRNHIRFDAGICPGEDTVFNLKTLLANATFCFVSRVGYVYYRTYTSSLARYQDRFDDSLSMRNAYWRKVNELLGVVAEAKMFGVLSDGELFRWSVENKWRFDTPLSLRSRYRFIAENRDKLRSHPLMTFLCAEIKCLLRRYFYIRPVRRWKVQHMFSNIKEVT